MADTPFESTNRPDETSRAGKRKRARNRDQRQWDSTQVHETIWILIEHPLFVADLLKRLDPTLASRLGLPRPFEAAAIKVLAMEWRAANNRYRKDLAGVLHNEQGEPVALYGVLMQGRYNPNMAGIADKFRRHLAQWAREHEWLAPSSGRSLPIWVGLIHTGTTPWPDAPIPGGGLQHPPAGE